MNVTLKYIDDDDKCYGLVGTAVGMLIYDCEDNLLALSVDENDPDKAISLVAELYFSGNPSMSAKVVWNNLIKQYEMMIGMTISNYLCRVLVHRKLSSVDPFEKNLLRQTIVEEGHDTCQLDDDEIDEMFNKGYNYLHRIFTHSAVQQIVHRFAENLRSARTMDHDEIERQLAPLRSL
ncbi:MAG: hypothetical protein UH625_03250 [Muribaculaceae bacterium]|nr:hypothetical protein [Muribaculaceae bacterium]